MSPSPLPPYSPFYPNSGQTRCYDTAGRPQTCAGSGQDAEFRPGLPWPTPRLVPRDGLVEDRLTGLLWSGDANPGGFPLAWAEAGELTAAWNQDRHLGRGDWRLPNRREMLSLFSFQHAQPALPPDHPFVNLTPGWRWTATPAAKVPGYYWYVHTDGGRMFYGHQDQYNLVWPVAGPARPVLPAPAPGPPGPGGLAWPVPRFAAAGPVVRDRLTGLYWSRGADLGPGEVSWAAALEAAAALGATAPGGIHRWRLPTIWELESLVDASRHSPALPADHPFLDLGEAYWSATSSAYDPSWAMALYLWKGAVGVGQKPGRHYRAWAVAAHRLNFD
ncbi:MAG: DUF1566 domain-containing protein [Deltaproteobacteria bacterium]|nr:DUF1566 domain-containing protein [Deltaproteobacteria bacterium]